MTNKKLQIVEYVKNKGLTSAHEIAGAFFLSSSMTHRHLKFLVEQGILIKKGTPPKVYYSLAELPKNEKISDVDTKIDEADKKVIEDNFLFLTPDGIEILGVEGFMAWCNDRAYSIPSKSKEYVKYLFEYNQFKKNGVIDATIKIKDTFKKDEIFLDHLFYLYPYSIPIFGKTKIAQWLFHAKQTQNRMLMRKVFEVVLPEILYFIREIKPNAIAFVPPTVPRNIQFMREIQKALKINLPNIIIEKIKTPIMIQQKSLKDVKDRIKNAENTMVIKNTNENYQKVLVIDDFTGSGSTMNILAKKIKNQHIGKEVIGVTITGSMNGFEVIREL